MSATHQRVNGHVACPGRSVTIRYHDVQLLLRVVVPVGRCNEPIVVLVHHVDDPLHRQHMSTTAAAASVPVSVSISVMITPLDLFQKRSQ